MLLEFKYFKLTMSRHFTTQHNTILRKQNKRRFMLIGFETQLNYLIKTKVIHHDKKREQFDLKVLYYSIGNI